MGLLLLNMLGKEEIILEDIVGLFLKLMIVMKDVILVLNMVIIIINIVMVVIKIKDIILFIIRKEKKKLEI